MSKDSRILDLRNSLNREISSLKADGLKKPALMVLVEILQYHLADHEKDGIPCKDSLEVLMRAVAATIEGNPEMGSYIAEKWRYAANTLPEELSEVMPTFKKAMKR